MCLALAVLSLMAPTSQTVDTGQESHTWSCGSAAVPQSLEGFPDRGDDATNCAGRTPASIALDAVVLAGVGLVAIAITSRRLSDRKPEAPPAEVAPETA